MTQNHKANMAHARAAKREPSAHTTKVQSAQRTQRALELMPFKAPGVVQKALQEEFDICSTAAKAAMTRARRLILKASEKDRKVHIGEVLAQLESTIRETEGTLRLKALEIKIGLLGLAEPQHIKADVAATTVPFDPAAAAAMHDPQLRSRILQLEEDLSDA